MSGKIGYLRSQALGEEATKQLESVLSANLEKRLNSHQSFSRTEIQDISNRRHRLFPDDFKLSRDDWEYLSPLANTYRSGLRPPHAISSHRPYIGPVIVFGKKILWRILHFFLSGAFEQLEDFHRHLIRAYARQLVENAELRKQLVAQESPGKNSAFG